VYKIKDFAKPSTGHRTTKKFTTVTCLSPAALEQRPFLCAAFFMDAAKESGKSF
jgi:hypothetical protein